MSRLSLAALAFAGLIGLAACGGDTESENGDAAEEETNEEAPAEEEGGEEGDDGEAADETVAVDAGEFFYDGIPETLPAGTVAFDLENTGEMPHDLVIEELGDETVIEETAGGESASGTVELEPGEYTIYCSIGNHRQQGMEQTVTVE
ncbi:plastocyanin [Lipingzhangella halophila]|uniref:Plastocyanin n=1 Tax=Lipingzhangella halophila TaxID=1783352 RepID=A0A7W7W6Q8_9ACTN|nr:cupredoxin domain-containing protein [Lipingzhangella halophila]MBB4935100.1 plastocyanin [Lipingzhangella halophila]